MLRRKKMKAKSEGKSGRKIMKLHQTLNGSQGKQKCQEFQQKQKQNCFKQQVRSNCQHLCKKAIVP